MRPVTTPHPSVNFDFLEAAYRRFPLPKDAIKALRSLGGPPVSLNPSALRETQLDTLAYGFGFLGAIMRGADGEYGASAAAEIVKANWPALIEPWVKWCLKYILTVEGQPITPFMIDFIDHVLISIPAFLTFPGGYHGRNHTIVLKRHSPDMQPLITQIWLRVIDSDHRTWGVWSSALLGFTNAVDDGRRVKPSTIGDGPYQEGTQVGLMLIRHMNTITLRVPEMSTTELDFAKLFVLCLSGACFVGRTPFDYIELRAYSVPALVGLIYTTACKRKMLHKAQLDSAQMTLTLDLVAVSSTFLDGLLQGSNYIVEAIKAGILKAIFRTNPDLFRCRERENVPADHKLYFPYTKLLNTISRFLVYPSVLHEFLRAAKPIMSSELEKNLEANAKVLSLCWERMKTKASVFRDLRSDMRASSPPSCSNNNCPKRRFGSSIVPVTRYFRCSGCSLQLYCSVDCSKEDWRAGHKEQCEEDSHILKGKLAYRLLSYRTLSITNPFAPSKGSGSAVTAREYAFFHAWLKSYLAENSQTINTMVKRVISDLKNRYPKPFDENTPEDVRLVVDGRKNPIIFIDYNRPELFPPAQCVRIVEPHKLTAEIPTIMPDVAVEWAVKLLERWRNPTLNASTIPVIGLFPREEQNTTWPIENTVVIFPMLPTLVEFSIRHFAT